MSYLRKFVFLIDNSFLMGGTVKSTTKINQKDQRLIDAEMTFSFFSLFSKVIPFPQ